MPPLTRHSQYSHSARSIGITYPACSGPRGTENWYICHCHSAVPASRLIYSFSFVQSQLTHCAFGLFYPHRDEFGIAFYAGGDSEPDKAILQAQAGFFAKTQHTDFASIKWVTKKINVTFSKADCFIRGNVLLAGDAAGTASPIAGLGTVLAISAWGWAVEHYWREQQVDPQQARASYQRNADSYVEIWMKRSRDIWLDIEKLAQTALTGAKENA
ncbi:hypothetical protein KKI93_20445 [Xenorhabdus bovienii]|uniref:FAD-dependent oxidoreductase n=1 Tax=Xenorhabdus bovienii TaxID=40576 RepID=UPI0023B23697|nr:hypothetical protein [Xenorhabdus bovienii]MDE9566342.1 hypothetical protein [Xenorhabdus bovienii]